MKAAIIGLIAVVVIALGGYFVFHNASSQTPSSTGQPPSGQTGAATITFDGSMFNPASLTVKAGTVVTIKNTSSQDLQMYSNPHPVHTDDTDLNVGIVAAGQRQTFTVTKTGTFGYHDHLDPSIQGQITIE